MNMKDSNTEPTGLPEIQAPVLPAAAQEAVVTYCGRRLTPEGTRECWGYLSEGVDDLPRGTKLYAAPVAAAPGIDLAYIRSLVSNWRTSKLREGMGWQEAMNICADALEVGLSLLDASPKGGSDASNIPEPFQECYSTVGDSWLDCPDDAEFVDGLAVGDTYTVMVSHYSVERIYRVTKAPDETNDDYAVEPVQATSAEGGSGAVDAARYRYLRDVWGGMKAIDGSDEFRVNISTPQWRGNFVSFDAAIDAAMQATSAEVGA